MLVNLLVIGVISAAGWASLFPQEALAVIAELKRQLRQRVISRAGKHGAKELERKLYEIASQRGIDRECVKELLAEQHALIVERLGEKVADDILGKADPTRRGP